MKRIAIYLSLLMSMMLSMSCQRRPLHDFYGGSVYVDIDLQVAPDALTQRSSCPEMFAVAFYDIETHKLVKTDYVPYEGGYVMVDPGDYDIVVYNSDTEYCQIRNYGDINTIEAFTSNVDSYVAAQYYRVMQLISRYIKPEETRSYLDYSLIYEPDHVYVHTESCFHVPYTTGLNNSKVLYAKPSTINERFTVTIGPVYKAEFTYSGEVFLAGMGSAKTLTQNTISGGPATIWFNIGLNADKTQLFTAFYAFGCYYPDDGNNVTLLLRLVDVTGNEYYREYDVTDQVKNGGHDIVIYDPITITPTPHETGAPTVNLWDEVITDIDI